ncbi:hypothetical protein AB9P91_002239 [Salmonella enterica]|uniref:hypothetical protein n=1 Tax=Salmonella enterica TaxID=28901 RepID=UPI0003BD4D11|nr:hypothetical protein SEEM1594_07545 [Salmonella enterica subsp. enterica serovar Muenchen str. baa1594]
MINTNNSFLDDEISVFLINRFVHNERDDKSDLLIDDFFNKRTTDYSKRQLATINSCRELIIDELSSITDSLFSNIRIEFKNLSDDLLELEKIDIGFFIDLAITKTMDRKRLKYDGEYLCLIGDILQLYLFRHNDNSVDKFFTITCSNLVSAITKNRIIKDYDDYVISFLISKNTNNIPTGAAKAENKKQKRKRTPSPHKIEVLKIIDNTLQMYPKTSTYSIVNLLLNHYKDDRKKNSYARWVVERRIATGTTVKKEEICKDRIKLIF